MSKNEFDALLLKKLQEEALEYNPDSWQQLSQRLPLADMSEAADGFDSLLISKLQEGDFEFQPKSWEAIQQKLNDAAAVPQTRSFDRKRWVIAIGSAAAVCAVIGLTINFQSGNKNDLNQNAGITTVKQTTIAAPATKAEQVQQPPAVGKSTNAIAHQNHTKTPAVKNGLGLVTPAGNPGSNSVEKVNTPIQEPVSTVVIKSDNKPGILIDKEKNKEIAKRNDAANAYAQSRINQMWPEPVAGADNAKKETAKTNVAFGGGVNYGNLNTGYTAGASLKRKIGSDFFVDGTVAMIYNNNVNNVAVNNNTSTSLPPAGAAAKNTASSFSSPALEPIQRLYYVQINPSLGYQLDDRIALSVGGDVQQNLNSSDQIVQPDNNNTKIFPTTDVGLTTKSEFTISPNLQAGLIYREGLNNLVGSDAGKYVNRRYLQVQFKYNIPLKN